MDGKKISRWYTLLWIETTTSKFYVALPFSSLNSAILSLFDKGSFSPNEFSREFQEIEKACTDSPIVCHCVDDDMPKWILAEECIVALLLKELKRRKISVALNQ
ncbi:MAG: hypothetical protein KME40_32090 [Komarekiella atlantica HA4396-MV6]|jgi:hypothetical protein|nr:hypothetical protein [Komarekiella atlantica HA4396-MV6]